MPDGYLLSPVAEWVRIRSGPVVLVHVCPSCGRSGLARCPTAPEIESEHRSSVDAPSTAVLFLWRDMMKTCMTDLHLLRRHGANARSKDEYTKANLAGLIESIREHGLLQPLVVTSDGDDRYTVLAGHRRLAALKALGATEVPCVVVDADEAKGLAVLVADNGQHRPVDPLSEADTVARLVERCSDEPHPVDRAAALVGKSPVWVRARLRLTTLTEAWRTARYDEAHPVHQFPVGHLEVVAALPAPVQDRLLEDCQEDFRSAVPLASDLRRIVAGYTCDLDAAPWDLAALDIVPSAPACSACPRRDSAQGGLFVGIDRTKGDRCLDAECFGAKKAATVRTALELARAKHGPAVAVEISWGFDREDVPSDAVAYRDFELQPLAKSKGGVPVLRLRDLKVAYMAKASRSVEPGHGSSTEPVARGPKSIEDRRRDLAKRRHVRALQLLRGSLLGHDIEVGTERHPETLTPPPLPLPGLSDLVALALAFGTGHPVGPDEDPPWDQTDAERLAAALEVVRKGAESEEVRARFWARLREPLARLLNPSGAVTHGAVEGRAEVAKAVCGLCGVSWEAAYLAPAVEGIPEPRSWASRQAS